MPQLSSNTPFIGSLSKESEDNDTGVKDVTEKKRIVKLPTIKSRQPVEEHEKTDDKSPIDYDAEKLKKRWSKRQPQLTNQFYNRVVEI